MSDAVWEVFFGISFTAIAVGIGAMLVAAALWLIGIAELNRCALDRNVYACEFVAQPIEDRE